MVTCGAYYYKMAAYINLDDIQSSVIRVDK